MKKIKSAISVIMTTPLMVMSCDTITSIATSNDNYTVSSTAENIKLLFNRTSTLVAKKNSFGEDGYEKHANIDYKLYRTKDGSTSFKQILGFDVLENFVYNKEVVIHFCITDNEINDPYKSSYSITFKVQKGNAKEVFTGSRFEFEALKNDNYQKVNEAIMNASQTFEINTNFKFDQFHSKFTMQELDNIYANHYKVYEPYSTMENILGIRYNELPTETEEVNTDYAPVKKIMVGSKFNVLIISLRIYTGIDFDSEPKDHKSEFFFPIFSKEIDKTVSQDLYLLNEELMKWHFQTYNSLPNIPPYFSKDYFLTTQDIENVGLKKFSPVLIKNVIKYKTNAEVLAADLSTILNIYFEWVEIDENKNETIHKVGNDFTFTFTRVNFELLENIWLKFAAELYFNLSTGLNSEQLQNLYETIPTGHFNETAMKSLSISFNVEILKLLNRVDSIMYRIEKYKDTFVLHLKMNQANIVREFKNKLSPVQ